MNWFNRFKKRAEIFCYSALLVVLSGCGYSFISAHSPLFEQEGVHKIYVAPVLNNTYKPGVENVVYNALVKVISAHHRVILVQNKLDADALLQGTVANAQSGAIAGTNASSLKPSGIGKPDVQVATIYSALLACQFFLIKQGGKPRANPVLWSSSFSRSKPFPAANQLGPMGTTSALINDSELDRVLYDMAQNMMEEVHESMLGMF